MTLTAGTRLGPYEVTALIGRGGMGEVHRAHDTKLNRDVALKVLPEQFALDADRLARFKREAQVLASLNHPNIAAIYGLEESDGVRALVLEFVEGPTLAELISGSSHQAPAAAETSESASRGAAARGGGAPRALSMDEALPIARQVAEALEAAHEHAIIHRDLKPANIKLRPDGVVKVLDFGLAKALNEDGATADLSHSPTVSLAATQAGVILGTAAYMSPEQAKGFAADQRSDLFSFGVVLYEMLTGRPPFTGDTVHDVLASVLAREPDLSALPSNLNPRLPELLRRCLEKNPKRRWQAVGDLRVELEVIAAAPQSAPAVTQVVVQPRPLWKRAIPVLGGVILATALTSVGWWNFRPSTTPLTITRFPFTLPEGQQFINSVRYLVAISPDGTQMAYVANGRLYLRSMSEFEARLIAGIENTQGGVLNPVFSPDGGSVAYMTFSGGTTRIHRIAVSGGTAVTISQIQGTNYPNGMSWGTDGIVFDQPAGIMRVSANGGKPELLVSVKNIEEAHGPRMLSGGQAVLFTLATGTGADRWDKAQIVVQSLRSGERKILIEGGSDARYVPTGHIVYALEGVLFAVPFDLNRLEVTGGPIPVVEGVRRSAGAVTGGAHFSVSDTGSLIYVPGPTGTRTIERAVALADRAGVVTRLPVPAGPYVHLRVSRDGTRLAVGSDDDKEGIVWIYRLDGTSAMQRLTLEGGNRFPIWSADGQRVAFQSDRGGDLGIFSQRVDGTGPAERLTKPEQGEAHVPESWSPDGRHVSFSVAKGVGFSLWTLSLDDKKATPYGDVQSGNPIGSVFSPDGRWIAYSSSPNSIGAPSPNRGVYVQPFPATGAIYQVPRQQFDFHPVWAPDGTELIYVPTVASGQFAAVSVTTRPAVTFGSPVSLPARVTADRIGSEMRAYDILPDGRFIGLVNTSEADSLRAAGAPEIRVVLNWFEELKRRVPTN